MTRGRARTAPATLVIFGGTGDLMQRKLLPALYRLVTQGLIHDRSQILGVARSVDMGDQRYRQWARQALLATGGRDDQVRPWCDRCVHYQAVGGGTAQEYEALARRLEILEHDRDLPGNRMFYLALPPQAVPDTVGGLGGAGLNRGPGWSRLVVEKPFGRELASAQELNRLIHQHFQESQIYRIDHYLGKETVQNLLVFRFANPIFETIWNRDRVEHVEITVAEDLGIEGRAGYYEQAGALRDMVQSHLTQLLTLVAMEIPGSFEADPIRNEKVKVLQSVAPIRPGDVVLGQYARGQMNGGEVPGYRQEPGVAADSPVETFAALALEIANWRWHGVPFYLRTGKRLPRRSTQIAVTFRAAPVSIFQPFAETRAINSNALLITLQPDEGFALAFEVKAPGQPITLETQRLHFRYSEVFAPLPDAYETLLLDILTGDQTLFVRADEVEAAWTLYEPILARRPSADFYPAGTWGPPRADELPRRRRL